MPKGQYTRKPRKAAEPEVITTLPAPESDPAMEEIARLLISDPEKAAEIANQPPMSPLFAKDRERIVKAYDAKPEAEANLSDEMKLTLAEYRDAVPQPVAEPKTFDSWMAEDDVPPPANDRVSQLVRQWAGAICNGWHDVTWQPANGGQAIEVTLITPHGTSILTKEAGNWRETDVEAALERMTTDLRL